MHRNATRFSTLITVSAFVTSCSQPPAPSSNDADASTSIDATVGDARDVAIDETSPTPRPDATIADVLMPPPISRTQTEAQLGAQRSSCAFGAGAWPAETIGTEYPVGADIPINHILVIMQENRSFDHYLGRLVAQGYYQPGDFSSTPGNPDAGRGSGFSHSDQLDGPPPGWSNPDEHGNAIAPHPDTEHCFTAHHGWEDMHDDYDNGLLDHFVTNNNPDGQRSISYVDDTVIPFYYALANTFAIGDRYFASVMTSTWPNRLFFMAATSFGIGDNSSVTLDSRAHPVTQIFSNLEAGHHTWLDYTDGPHQEAFFSYFGIVRSATSNHYRNARCDLFNDIANGTLPDVGVIMGDEVSGFSDEGPSNLPQIGGAWVENIVRAVFASPSWHDTAVFITYDENGGMADHVPPVAVCPPDQYAPHDGAGTSLAGAFNQTGFRVPFIAISPYARAHFVSHTAYDHTSLTRFIESRFGLPAMTNRDANATPPMEMFDFQSNPPPFMTPPNIAAHTVVDPAILTQCNQVVAQMGCPDQ